MNWYDVYDPFAAQAIPESSKFEMIARSGEPLRVRVDYEGSNVIQGNNTSDRFNPAYDLDDDVLEIYLQEVRSYDTLILGGWDTKYRFLRVERIVIDYDYGGFGNRRSPVITLHLEGDNTYTGGLDTKVWILN